MTNNNVHTRSVEESGKVLSNRLGMEAFKLLHKKIMKQSYKLKHTHT